MNKVIDILKMFSVEFDVVNENEIRIPCPIDECINASSRSLVDICNDVETTCISDEGYIYISLNEENELSWLVAIER